MESSGFGSSSDIVTCNTKTSQLLSTDDILQSRMIIDQQWQLSNAHYLHAALYPHKLCRGKYQTFSSFYSQYESGVKFPMVLGKSSTIRKNYGIGQEILAQGTLQTFDLNAFSTTIAPVLLQRLLQPFQDKESKEQAHSHLVNFLQQYRLIRSDIDFMHEITSVNSKIEFNFGLDNISAAMKAKMTRDCTAANLSDRQQKGKANADTNDEQVEKVVARKATGSKRKSTPATEKKPKSSRKKASMPG